jgi:hypothetical protein
MDIKIPQCALSDLSWDFLQAYLGPVPPSVPGKKLPPGGRETIRTVHRHLFQSELYRDNFFIKDARWRLFFICGLQLLKNNTGK